MPRRRSLSSSSLASISPCQVSLPRVNLTFYALNVATQQVISASGLTPGLPSWGASCLGTLLGWP